MVTDATLLRVDPPLYRERPDPTATRLEPRGVPTSDAPIGVRKKTRPCTTTHDRAALAGTEWTDLIRESTLSLRVFIRNVKKNPRRSDLEI
jgi:hypothetical protein